MQSMNFEEAVSYIRDKSKKGIIPGLENMEALCSALGSPQKKIKTIHIAGTNGKGSIGTFIEQMLIEQGFKVGRYASPAVLDYRDIIRFNGENISKTDFALCVEKVKAAVENLPEKNLPTSFEMETAVAFVYFNMKECDYAVVECGMGGRLDATNITDKVLAVFASISIDHTAFLGDTIEKIAEEKAGIIKNCPVVSAEQKKSVKDVIIKKCENAVFVDCSDIKNTVFDIGGTVFDYKENKQLKIALLGKHQTENASVAVEAAKVLGLDEACIRRGLENAVWKCRFEVIGKNPLVIADGAHNYDAVLRLKENIEIYMKDKPLYFVMGMLKDKDYKNSVREIAKLANCVYTITPNNARGLDGTVLADCIIENGGKAKFCKSVPEAIESAKKSASNEGAVIIFGSLSFLSEVYAVL